MSASEPVPVISINRDDEPVTLAVDVGVLKARLGDLQDDVRDMKGELGGKLDALATSLGEHGQASAASFKTLDTRLADLETVVTTARTVGRFALAKAGPVIVALLSGLALSPAVMDAIKALLAAK